MVSNGTGHLAVALATLAALASAYCRGHRDSQPSDASPPAAGPRAPDPRNRPYPCTKDADCPSLACGPCTPGEVILNQGMKECSVNPCLDARAVCGPGKLCIVNAEARKNPMVWCRACFDLEFDKSKLCARRKGDAGVAECHTTIDDTARSCDQDKCAKARLAIESDQSLSKQVEARRRRLEQEQLKRYNETRDWFDRAAKH